ncbi:hypothetical protein [Micromonospora sp. GCM10011541]|uniref:VG15 protein n=1 Tax=Micromonospora sp. GCM10011541 TaxID=3317336 RepID=UPI0036108815
MTPEQRAAEADKTSVAYQVALTQIGAATIEDAIKIWAGVPPTATAATAGRWLSEAVRLVMTRRGQARALAMAYYRLVRALRTGRTIADPREPAPRYVTLAMLRDEFAELAGEPAQKPQEGGERSTPSTTTDAPSTGADDAQGGQDDSFNEDRIPVEKVDGNSAAEENRLARLAEQEARIVLEALGPKNLEDKVSQLDTDAPAKEVDAARQDAHKAAGSRQASAAERIAMDGGRGTVWNYAARDKRVIGYVRVSQTGTPCGWCAMLISRGLVRKGDLYKSKASAEYSDGDKYHDNCHCVAEPVYSDTQFNSPLYDLNRKYAKEWPTVTKGLSGKAALSAWRRFIRLEQERLAQEASQPRAQEASSARRT